MLLTRNRSGESTANDEPFREVVAPYWLPGRGRISVSGCSRCGRLRGVAVHAAEIHDRFRLAVEHVEDRGEMRDPQDSARVGAGMQQLQLAAARGHVAID